MTTVLTLLSSPDSAVSDNALKKLATFLGVSCVEADWEQFAEAPPAAGGAVVAVSSQTLRQGFVGGVTEADARHFFCRRAAKVLVYGFKASPEDSRLLQALTDGAVSGVEPTQNSDRRYAFNPVLDRLEIPLAGLSWETRETRLACTFIETAGGSALLSLVSLSGKPLLASWRTAETEFFLLADPGIADIDAWIAPSGSALDFYPTLLPAVVFLRTAFRQACWSNPFRTANLIIDDPLIRRRYGFLKYETLLSEAGANGYAVTLGFIPFNHARSHREVAGFLRGHLDRFSLAVHGCDHTGREFGALDDALLVHKARLALERMHQHQELTSLPFDPVMVFPQGVYSTGALKALKQTGYQAAVSTNATAHPVDCAQHPLALRHLLDGAMTAYHSFPLFLRRYPGSVFDSAVDLLFGKPLLLVEHHGYFKAGYEPLASFVRNINRLADGLAWVPLGQALTAHALFRPLGPGRYAARFFTPAFQLRNPAAIRASFLLEKSEMEGAVDHVAINGRRVDFTVRSGVLACEAELGPGEACRVKVAYHETPTTSCTLSLRYRGSAAARRYLSEIRDNYLARSERLLSLATRLKNVAQGPRCRP